MTEDDVRNLGRLPENSDVNELTDIAAELYARLLIEDYEARRAERELQRKNKITPPEK